MLLYMWKEAYRNEVKHNTLSFPNFPSDKPLRLFFISDVHRRTIHPSIIRHIQNKTDLIVIGGDLLEGGVPFKRTARNLQMLSNIAPIYFVWGNNDYEVNEKAYTSLLTSFGVTILRNKAAAYEMKGGGTIWLIGVDDVSKGNSNKTDAFKCVPENGFKIFISHNPLFKKNLKDEDKISLMLSGHTHGGQIRLFGLGLYDKGKIWREKESIILISNGYGTTTVPLRLGSRAETHLLTISKGKKCILK
ncbi:MAG: metallophosphoesterase family protein [Bacillales bacterium]|nr:metallophosphoesterase family protein [Bacillales bacterium]